MKNTIQVIGLVIYNIGLLIEAAVESDQIHDAIKFLKIQHQVPNPDFWVHLQPFIIAVPCVMAIGTVCMALATWKLYHEFAWSIYKDISADLRLKRRFLSYQVRSSQILECDDRWERTALRFWQIYIALLKFDFFFFVAFTVQFLVVVERTTNIEFRLTIIAIPITIILLILGAYWARHENLVGTICILVSCERGHHSRLLVDFLLTCLQSSSSTSLPWPTSFSSYSGCILDLWIVSTTIDLQDAA